jgi:hypothetical protein
MGKANSRTTRFRRDLVLLTISLVIVGLTISFLIVGLLIFEEWQRQVDAFHLSIKEYAESLCTPGPAKFRIVPINAVLFISLGTFTDPRRNM